MLAAPCSDAQRSPPPASRLVYGSKADPAWRAGDAPTLVGVEVVEVPIVAYEAALALFRDLLDVSELEHDRCPLCEKVYGDASLHDECPVGRASLVRAALDYSNPAAQVSALKALRPEALDEAPSREPQGEVLYDAEIAPHLSEVASCVDKAPGDEPTGAIVVAGVPRVGSAPARTFRIEARAFAQVEGRVRVGVGAEVTRLVLEGGHALDVDELLVYLTTHEDGDDGDVGDGSQVTFLLVLPPYDEKPTGGAA